MLDIGAHIGAFTLKAAKTVGPGGMVVAVEPESRNVEPESMNFALLSENVSLSGCDNVAVLRKAVANFSGKAICIWEAAHCLIQSFSGDLSMR